MHMDDVDGVRVQYSPDLASRARVHRKVERNASHDAVYGKTAHPRVLTGCLGARRGDHPHVISSRGLTLGKGPHLRLDTPRARGVAVADVGDPHG